MNDEAFHILVLEDIRALGDPACEATLASEPQRWRDMLVDIKRMSEKRIWELRHERLQQITLLDGEQYARYCVRQERELLTLRHVLTFIEIRLFTAKELVYGTTLAPVTGSLGCGPHTLDDE